MKKRIKLIKFGDDGNTDKVIYQQSTNEVPTKNYVPPFAPLNKEFVFQAQNAPAESHIQPSPERKGAISKAATIARNPMTALQYKIQGQPIPDNMEMGNKNVYDNAIDVINPMTYLDAAGRTVSLKHFRENGFTPDALVKTGLDAAMMYGVGNEFKVGSKEIANPLGNRIEANVPVQNRAIELDKMRGPGIKLAWQKGKLTPEQWTEYNQAAKNQWIETPRYPIKVPTVKAKGTSYQRVPAGQGEQYKNYTNDGSEIDNPINAFGVVDNDGTFRSYVNEPNNVRNSPEFDNQVRNAQARKTSEYEEIYPSLNYDLQKLDNPTKGLPGFNYNSSIQQPQQNNNIATYQSPTNNQSSNTLQSIEPSKVPIRKKIQQVQQPSAQVPDTISTPQQDSQRRVEWLHSHNGETPVLDSTRILDTSKQYGGYNNTNTQDMSKLAKFTKGGYKVKGFERGGPVAVDKVLNFTEDNCHNPVPESHPIYRAQNGMMEYGGQQNLGTYLGDMNYYSPIAHYQDGGVMTINDKNPAHTNPAGMYWNGREYVKSSGSNMNGAAWSQYGGPQSPQFQLPAPTEYAYLQNGGSTRGGYSQYGGVPDNDGDIDRMRDGGEYIDGMKHGGIHINPANKGKFNATKKATGKTTEELTHSSNSVTRKRAVFAQNAKHFKHEYGGNTNLRKFVDGGNTDLTTDPITGAPLQQSQGYNPTVTGQTGVVSDTVPQANWNQGMSAKQSNQNIVYNRNGQGSTNAYDPDTHNTDNGPGSNNARQDTNNRRAIGQAGSNLLGAGLMAGAWYADRKNQRDMQGYNREQGMTSNAFKPVQNMGSHGDYTQQGSFRPDAQVPVAAGNFYAHQQYGGVQHMATGGYIQGSVHEMDDATINQLKKQGYQIEYV